MTNLSWAIIGASDIASSRMIPALRERGDFVHSVFSSDAQRGVDFSRANDIPTSTDDLESALLADVDAVYISSRNDLHFSHTMAALAAGKHVLCEKPLALSIDDAQTMIQFAEVQGLTLATNHHLPGSPLHSRVRDLVAAGAIGRVLSARIHHAVELPDRLRGWRLAGKTAGAGVVMDITCHDASVLGPLLGDPVKVAALGLSQGDGPEGGATDAAMTVIEYRGPHGEPIIAQTHDAFTVAFDRTSLEVQGTSGSILVEDAMTQDAGGTITLITTEGQSIVDVDTDVDLYGIILDRFAQATVGEGIPTATGRDGLNALTVALAAERSIRESASVSIADVRVHDA